MSATQNTSPAAVPQTTGTAGSTETSREYGLVDAHTIRARSAERAELRADIDAFLARGGEVTQVVAELRTDLPRKPANNYGKGSL